MDDVAASPSRTDAERREDADDTALDLPPIETENISCCNSIIRIVIETSVIYRYGMTRLGSMQVYRLESLLLCVNYCIKVSNLSLC